MSRERVYALLRQRAGAFCSGEELSRALGISRAAVWKAVDSLRRDGYTIEARRSQGYRLVAAPDVLVEREIRRYLPGDVPCPDLRCLQEVDSTNSYLKREAMNGAPHGTIAVANCQTAGRGRMARRFQSPPDCGVYLSILLRPELMPEQLMGATGMAAVAVCDAVEKAAGVRPQIKWTNDLILHGRKLGGILTELSLEGETGRPEYLIIGVGLNVRQRAEDFPPEVADIATSLAAQGHEVSRAALAAALIGAFGRLSRDLGGDITPWVEAYRRDCVTLGREVRLLWSEDQERGLALDVDGQFGLVVRRADGTETTVRTGEVSVRGLYGYVE